MPPTPTPAMRRVSLGAWYPGPPKTCRGTTSAATLAAVTARRVNRVPEFFGGVFLVHIVLLGIAFVIRPSSRQWPEIDVPKCHRSMVALKHQRIFGRFRDVHA